MSHREWADRKVSRAMNRVENLLETIGTTNKADPKKERRFRTETIRSLREQLQAVPGKFRKLTQPEPHVTTQFSNQKGDTEPIYDSVSIEAIPQSEHFENDGLLLDDEDVTSGNGALPPPYNEAFDKEEAEPAAEKTVAREPKEPQISTFDLPPVEIKRTDGTFDIDFEMKVPDEKGQNRTFHVVCQMKDGREVTMVKLNDAVFVQE